MHVQILMMNPFAPVICEILNPTALQTVAGTVLGYSWKRIRVHFADLSHTSVNSIFEMVKIKFGCKNIRHCYELNHLIFSLFKYNTKKNTNDALIIFPFYLLGFLKKLITKEKQLVMIIIKHQFVQFILEKK